MSDQFHPNIKIAIERLRKALEDSGNPVGHIPDRTLVAAILFHVEADVKGTSDQATHAATRIEQYFRLTPYAETQ